MADFSEKVKQYGSVSAALAASGYSKGSNGSWTKDSGSSGSSGGVVVGATNPNLKVPTNTGSSGSSGGTSGAGVSAPASNQNNATGGKNGITYTQQQGAGIYGALVLNSDVKNYTQNVVTYQTGPTMARTADPNIIKNGYYISNGYTVFVDQDGYATKAVKGVADYTPHMDINAGNGTYNSAGAWTDNEMLT